MRTRLGIGLAWGLLLVCAAFAGAAEKQSLTQLYEIEQNGKIGFIDASGRVVVKPQFDSASGGFKEGFTRVRKGPWWGYMDTTGRVVTMRYDSADDFVGGRARVELKKRWGFVDHEGIEVVEPVYEDVADFHDGLARVKKNDRWGFVNLKGREVIPPQYKDAEDLREGMARVKLNKLWGYINQQGSLAIEFRFRDADDFNGGVARVKDDQGQPGYINKQGVFIWRRSTE